VVSAETVCVLLRSGAPEEEIERALAVAFGRGTSLARYLCEQALPLASALERELSRGDFSSIELVRPLASQVALLPPGLCQRLGVVPVNRDARSGRVDAAVLDPLDPHVRGELEFHLDAPVRLLRAREEALLPALAALAPGPAPSGPPLPLVRKAPQHEEAAVDEPVLSLSRPKAEKKSTEPIVISSRTSASASVIPPAPETTPFEPEVKPGPATAPLDQEPEPVEAVVADTERAGAAEELVALMLRGMAPAPSVVLSVRAGAYSGRAASPGLPAEAAQKIKLTAGTASVVETAVRTGLYLGVLPHTPAHRTLRELFGGDGEAEVYVVPVLASGHPTLVLVSEIAKLGPSLAATARADYLARAVGKALERIVLCKKRGG
jgi:hypothetical protein